MSDVIPDVSDRVPTRADVPWSQDGGRVTIVRRKFGAVGTLVLKLFRVRPDMTLRLDRVASDAWLLMDGRKVSAVLAKLRELHPNEADLPGRLGRFLSQMVSHGFVRLD